MLYQAAAWRRHKLKNVMNSWWFLKVFARIRLLTLSHRCPLQTENATSATDLLCGKRSASVNLQGVLLTVKLLHLWPLILLLCVHRLLPGLLLQPLDGIQALCRLRPKSNESPAFLNWHLKVNFESYLASNDKCKVVLGQERKSNGYFHEETGDFSLLWCFWCPAIIT